MSLLKKYLRPQRGYVALAVVCIIIDAACELYLPILMSDIVGRGIETGDVNYIIKIGCIMLALSVLAMLCGVGNSISSSRAGVGFATGVRRALFEKVQRFSFKNIDSFSTSSLSTRLTNDVTQMQNTTVMGMRMVVRVPVMLTFALFMAISLNAQLAKVFLVTVPLLFVAIFIIAPKALPLFTKMQQRVDGVNRDVQENITNIRVVKSFVREDYEREKFNTSSDDLMNASMRAMNLIITAMPIMMLLMNASTCAVLWIGGKQVINGIGNAAQLTAFLNYILHVLMSLMMLAMLFVMISRASASFKRAGEVLNAEIDLVDAPDAVSADDIRGELEFCGVNFKYDPNDREDVLHDISFTASPGQTVAIIGATGSGKSSLVHLVPRLYDVTDGAVLVDGRDVREYRLESLRSRIGVVLQKNTLFSGTIRENLLWGNKNATEQEMKRAAADACIADFIESLPDGYDSRVEQGGVNFSGGQRQRLCIARAILKAPAILILDDSTSAVDTATESNIKKAFAAALKNTTTLLIAQRISSVQDADKIIVLDDGEIVAAGTHEQLLETSENYREIYDSQVSGKEAV